VRFLTKQSRGARVNTKIAAHWLLINIGAFNIVKINKSPPTSRAEIKLIFIR
jgi:hypothetical protein